MHSMPHFIVLPVIRDQGGKGLMRKREREEKYKRLKCWRFFKYHHSSGTEGSEWLTHPFHPCEVRLTKRNVSAGNNWMWFAPHFVGSICSVLQHRRLLWGMEELCTWGDGLIQLQENCNRKQTALHTVILRCVTSESHMPFRRAVELYLAVKWYLALITDSPAPGCATPQNCSDGFRHFPTQLSHPHLPPAALLSTSLNGLREWKQAHAVA